MIKDMILTKWNKIVHIFYGEGDFKTSKTHAKKKWSKSIPKNKKSNKTLFIFLFFFQIYFFVLSPPLHFEKVLKNAT